jgi:hypothetical protein
MNPAVAFIEGHLAELRTVARVRVSEAHHAAIVESGLVPLATVEAADPDCAHCIVLVDILGGEWAATLPGVW